MALHNKTSPPPLLFALILTTTLLSCGGSSAFKRGLEYEKLKNYDAALQSYEEALNQDPGNTNYRLHFQRARFQAAIAHFDQGRHLKNANRLEEALQEFQRALAIDPSITSAEQEVTAVTALIRKREKQAEEKKSAQPGAAVPPSQQFLPFIKLSGEVRRAYETLGKLGGINVIFAPDFNPSPSQVALDLSDVTLTEALDLLSLQSKTYWSAIKENTILVAVDTQQTRQRYQEEIIKIFHLSNVDDQQELGQITTALRSLLLMNKVAQVDSQNAIVVRDTPDKVAAAEQILRSIDRSKPEVLIEVLILEVLRTIRQFLGIRPGLPNVIDYSGDNPPAEGTSIIAVKDLRQIGGSNFFVTVPSTQLGHLYTRANGRVLQNPTLRSTDGKLAKLRVGTQQPVASGSFSSGIGGTAGFGGGAFTTFTTVDVGVTLDITPHVLLNRDIAMKITVALKTITGFETLDGNRYPILANREIDHDIRLREGESSIVGGIIQQSDTVTIEGVPGLSKIPLLRYLFSTEDNRVADNEVIIVITPRILRLPDLLEEEASLALLGSSNNPKFLGRRKQLIGEVPAAKPAPAEEPTTTNNGGSAAVDETSLSPEVPAARSDRPVPRLAFVKLIPPSEPVALGNQFTVAVSVTNAQQVHGLSFNLRFNPANLQLVDVQAGGFLSSDGNSVALAQRPDNQLGRVVVSMTRPPEGSGVSGTGLLTNLRFEAVGSGDGSLSFGPNSLLRDSSQTAIPTSFTNAQVTVK